MIFQTLRAVFGFILVLFVPGFAATWALFPRKGEVDIIERIALSIGLSIALVVLSIYLMNTLFGIPINLVNSLLVIFLITFICSVIGYLRGKGSTGVVEATEENAGETMKAGKDDPVAEEMKKKEEKKVDSRKSRLRKKGDNNTNLKKHKLKKIRIHET